MEGGGGHIGRVTHTHTYVTNAGQHIGLTINSNPFKPMEKVHRGTSKVWVINFTSDGKRELFTAGTQTTQFEPSRVDY